MKNLINPLLIILVAVVLRLLPHPPNFAPIAGLALFGGAYLNKKYALILPLIALFASDLFIGFHSTMPFVYGSFLLSGLIGLGLQSKKSVPTVFGASLLSSVLFFVITNFGVWAVSGMYAPTIEGLVKCYTLALPFFRNTLLGDFFYTGLFFTSYELARRVAQNPKKAISLR